MPKKLPSDGSQRANGINDSPVDTTTGINHSNDNLKEDDQTHQENLGTVPKSQYQHNNR